MVSRGEFFSRQLLVAAVVICHAARPILAATTDNAIRSAAGSYLPDILGQLFTAFRADRQITDPSESSFAVDSLGSLGTLTALQYQSPNDSLAYHVGFTEVTYPIDSRPANMTMLPLFAISIKLIFNVPGINKNLRLPYSALVGIFNGSVRFWNDSAVSAYNAQLADVLQSLNTPIILIGRNSSGMTLLLQRGLASASSQWAHSIGISSNWYRPTAITYVAKGNSDLISVVNTIPNSFGYKATDGRNDTQIDLLNENLRLVEPTAPSLLAEVRAQMMDVTENPLGNYLIFDLSKAKTESHYIFSGMVYAIMPLQVNDLSACDSMMETVRFLKYIYYNPTAKSILNADFKVPIPDEIASRVWNEMIPHINCGPDAVSRILDNYLKRLALSKQGLSSGTVALAVTVSLCTCATIISAIVAIAIHAFERHVVAAKVKLWLFTRSDLRTVVDDKAENLQSANSSQVNSSGSSRSLASDSSMQSQVEAIILKPANQCPSLKATLKNGEFVQLTYASWLPAAQLSVYMTKKYINHLVNSIKINDNLVRFVGVFVNEPSAYIIGEFFRRGTLRDVLKSDRIDIKDNFKTSMVTDVANGMVHLHNQNIVHGKLSSLTCYLSDRWVVKVGHWMDTCLGRELEKKHPTPKIVKVASTGYNHLDEQSLWAAPEMLSGQSLASKRTDIYSFALLTYETFSRCSPFESVMQKENLRQVIPQIISGSWRPSLAAITSQISQLIVSCWNSDAAIRPDFISLLTSLELLSQGSLLDQMMLAMEETLTKLKSSTRAAEKAKQDMESLLHKMFPAQIAAQLAAGQTIQPEYFELVTIFFSDIVGFTTISSTAPAGSVVALLNELFAVFDDVVDNFDAYKVETIGDAYMIVSGLPKRNGIGHVVEIARVAVAIMRKTTSFRCSTLPEQEIQIRIGVNTGPAMAGVIGNRMPRYCIFGDTVNIAARMESTSEPMKIQITSSTADVLQTFYSQQFVLECRGDVNIKGKGNMTTYWLRH